MIVHQIKKIPIKIPFLITIFFFLLTVNLLAAKSMTCAIPKYAQKHGALQNYIELVEPKTVVSFDSSQNISRFNSPGCNKFDNISRLTNSFSIKCYSNNADSIKLKIDALTMRFEKTYFKREGKQLSLVGFCRISEKVK